MSGATVGNESTVELSSNVQFSPMSPSGMCGTPTKKSPVGSGRRDGFHERRVVVTLGGKDVSGNDGYVYDSGQRGSDHEMYGYDRGTDSPKSTTAAADTKSQSVSTYGGYYWALFR